MRQGSSRRNPCKAGLAMASRAVKVWYDTQGDFLEVVFDERPGYYRETDDDHVMERVDQQGHVIGFQVFNLSKMRGPVTVTLPEAEAS